MRRVSGFALAEAISILAVVALLGAIAMTNASRELESAERMQMETQARAIGNALQLRMANLIAQGKERDILRLAADNPVRLLPAPPPNYLGALTKAPDKTAAGVWYFDQSSGELVYHVRRGDRFLPDAAGRRRVRFRVEVVREDAGERTPVVGAVFRPVEPYRWR